MRRLTAIVAIAVLLLPGLSSAAPRASRQVQALGTLAGTATDSAGQTLANVVVQLRDVVTGAITGTATSSATGTFSFAALPGTYSVEIVSNGLIVGASATTAVVAGATTTITVSAVAGALGSIGAGAAGLGAAGGAGGAAAGIGAVGIIGGAAAAAGIAGLAAAESTPDASPSR